MILAQFMYTKMYKVKRMNEAYGIESFSDGIAWDTGCYTAGLAYWHQHGKTEWLNKVVVDYRSGLFDISNYEQFARKGFFVEDRQAEGLELMESITNNWTAEDLKNGSRWSWVLLAHAIFGSCTSILTCACFMSTFEEGLKFCVNCSSVVLFFVWLPLMGFTAWMRFAEYGRLCSTVNVPTWWIDE